MRPASCRWELIGSIADFRDQEAFRAIVRRSRRLGFICASAVHPLQVFVLNEEFSPDPGEVERAERMIAAYDDAYAAGLGAVQFEGAMIDVPVVERARSVVKRAVALRSRIKALARIKAWPDQGLEKRGALPGFCPSGTLFPAPPGPVHCTRWPPQSAGAIVATQQLGRRAEFGHAILPRGRPGLLARLDAAGAPNSGVTIRAGVDFSDRGDRRRAWPDY